MFKVYQDNKIVSVIETNNVVGIPYDLIEEDTEHTVEDYIHHNGEFILKDDVPVSEQNEQIRLQRQSRYVTEADPLKLDYDESVARESDDIAEKKRLWLEKKDQIREELPYVKAEE